MPDIAHGTEWNQTCLRLLENGDYIRVSVETYGDRTRIQLGNAVGPIFEWKWEMVLPMWDINFLALDMSFAAAQAARHSHAGHAQAEDRRRQLQAQVDRLKQGLPATEDAQDGAPAAAEASAPEVTESPAIERQEDQDGEAHQQEAEQPAG